MINVMFFFLVVFQLWAAGDAMGNRRSGWCFVYLGVALLTLLLWAYRVGNGI